jgi:hypothetical protein
MGDDGQRMRWPEVVCASCLRRPRCVDVGKLYERGRETLGWVSVELQNPLDYKV